MVPWFAGVGESAESVEPKLMSKQTETEKRKREQGSVDPKGAVPYEVGNDSPPAEVRSDFPCKEKEKDSSREDINTHTSPEESR